MPPKKKLAGGGTVFNGLVFCLSGKLNMSKSDFTQIIVLNGGKVVSTVNAQCTHLVSDNSGSAKQHAAAEKGVTIVNEDWIQDCVKTQKVPKGNKNQLTNEPPVKPPKGKSPSKKRKAADDDEEEDEDEDGGDDDGGDDDEDGGDDDEEDEDEKPKAKSSKRAKTAKTSKATSSKKAGGGGGGGGGSNVFSGETIVVSGKMSLGQKEIEALISNNGGTVASSLTKAVTYVLAEEIGSSKTVTAEEKGIPIVNEQWLHDSIEKGAIQKGNKYKVSS